MNRKIRAFFSESFTFVGFLLAIYIVLSLVQWYNSVVDSEISEVSRREMEDSARYLEFSLESIIEDRIQSLMLLATYIEKLDADEENIIESLKSQSQISKFEVLYYINANGKSFALDNSERDFSENSVFHDALRCDFKISDPHMSPSKRELVFDIAVPVKRDNQVLGVLYIENSMKDFYDVLEQMTIKTSWVFFLNHSLDILFTTSDKHQGMRVIPEEDLLKMTYKNVEQAQNNIIAGNSGSFTYGVDEEKKIMVYSPIKMTHWALAVTTKRDEIAESLNEAVGNINSVAFLIMLILLGLSVYTWLTKTSLLRSLEKTAYYDSLTGLPNLTKIKKDMDKVLKENPDKQYAIMKMDIVNFKVINEIFGFEVGNQVLQAAYLTYEASDEPSLIVARISADEFLIFAGNGFLDNIEKRISVYENYFRNLLPQIKSHKLSFSYGKYQIEKGETNVDTVVNNVSLAHKMAKESKTKSIHYYNEVVKIQLLLEAELSDKMEYALTNEEFKVFLQPKYSLSSDTLIGAEALIRWISGSGKTIYPDVFIPLFEKNGFIKEVDKFVLETVCKSLRLWIDSGAEIIPISVNCSRINLANSKLVDEIVEVADKYQIPHEYIDIELTESAMLGNEECITTLFKNLHNHGFKVSIDDFGAGYSSLGLLRNLKADTLKLDKSFIGDNEDIARSNKVINGVISLAHSLNMNVIAEGVETAEQVSALRKIKCDAVQGYFYAKPMPITDFESSFVKFSKNA